MYCARPNFDRIEWSSVVIRAARGWYTWIRCPGQIPTDRSVGNRITLLLCVWLLNLWEGFPVECDVTSSRSEVVSVRQQ